MALALTGWSYVRGWEVGQDWADVPGDKPGQFFFRKNWHQPGSITLMGKRYGQRGVAKALAILADLARARATAEHIAFKLVRHFITDMPTPAMVKPVADAFHASRGDLKQTTLALLALPAALEEPLGKIRTPYEITVAQYRALGVGPKDDAWWLFFEPLRAMDNLPWERPAPDGYSDETASWLDPDGMTIRLDTAMLAVDVYRERVRNPALTIARSLYGASLSDDAVSALTWIKDQRAALTLLFMTPEFQRR